jgi:hypothetical protein
MLVIVIVAWSQSADHLAQGCAMYRPALMSTLLIPLLLATGCAHRLDR